MIKRQKDLIEYIAIIIFALGTGSLYFQVLRMPVMAAMELFAAVLIIIFINRKISIKNVRIFGLITLFYFISSVVNYSNGFHVNDLIIWLVNSLFIIVLLSSVDFESFCIKYVNIMTIEAATSLICCFIAYILGKSTILPLLTYGENSANGYYLTPYFTVGWKNMPLFNRNAGMYWEPGGHQIFLNFALFLLLNTMESNTEKFRKVSSYLLKIFILIVAIITTFSSSGYVCLVLILLSTLFNQNQVMTKKQKRVMYFIAVAFLALALYIEIKNGVVYNKIAGTKIGQGSGRTRLNDTVIGYNFALQRPLLGFGSFAENLSGMLQTHNVTNISNGMAFYAMKNGIIFTITLLVILFKRVKKLFPFGIISNLFFFLYVLVCVNTEGVFMNLLMITLVYNWGGVQEESTKINIDVFKKHFLCRRCLV